MCVSLYSLPCVSIESTKGHFVTPLISVSEGLWVLANLTNPIRVRGGGQFSRDLDDRSGDRNSTVPRLFSFAHPRLRDTHNFTNLFYSRTENDYTKDMWNGDVALIVHVSNLTSQIIYKVCEFSYKNFLHV